MHEDSMQCIGVSKACAATYAIQLKLRIYEEIYNQIQIIDIYRMTCILI